MNYELQEELLRLNSKVDHIGRIVCELFVMTKSNELLQEKIDMCIRSLNSINSKIEAGENNKIRNANAPFSLPPPPPPLPTVRQTINSNSICQNTINSSHTLLLQELKEKLKDKLIV